MNVKKTKSLSVVFVLLYYVLVGCTPADHEYDYDVIIYGATSGGITAAIQSARMGKKVALLEPGQHVGGINVEGLGGTDIDNHPEFRNSPAVGGLALEFYKRIAIEYGREAELDSALENGIKKPELWRFEPHVAEKVIAEWLGENSIDIFYGSRLKESADAVRKDGAKITSLTTDNGDEFFGRVFIDASIEGDLLHRTGVSTVIGRESNNTYNETRNGIREHTTHNQFKVEVDPYVIPGKPESGVIPTIQNEPLGVPGSGDHRLQAYCFRVCLTKDPANRIPFIKPADYDSGNYEIYLRYLKAGGKLYTPTAKIPNNKTDLNGGADLSHNLFGMNFEYPSGTYAVREKIYEQHKNFTQGLFYFMANDEAVGQLAPALQKEWALWGLAKDEFPDNAGWPRQFYVRDARRMVSDYVITEHHAKKDGGIAVEDPVAVAYWPPDVHSVRRIVVEGKAYNEGFVFGGDWWKPFGISYRALVPKELECQNLLTAACPSSSHIAYGAIRIEWTFMALGQAVGTAASLAIDNKCNVQDVDYAELKNQLSHDGQITTVKAVVMKGP